MSDATKDSATKPEDIPKRNRRSLRVGSSILARGEPMLWLAGGGLVVCLLMVLGLLGLVLWQGMTTFWPAPTTKPDYLSPRPVQCHQREMVVGDLS